MKNLFTSPLGNQMMRKVYIMNSYYIMRVKRYGMIYYKKMFWTTWMNQNFREPLRPILNQSTGTSSSPGCFFSFVTGGHTVTLLTVE